METKNNNQLFRSIVIEGTIILSLVFILLIILNFFNIIVLSKISSLFSFLPHQEIIANRVDNSLGNAKKVEAEPKINIEVVSSKNPSIHTNADTKEIVYKYLDKGVLNVSSKVETTIDIDLELTTGVGAENISGIYLAQDLAKDNTKSLFLFYYPKDKTWTLQYKNGNNKKYFIIKDNPENKIAITVSLIISKDGKMVTIKGIGDNEKVWNLTESITEGVEQLFAIVHVGPTSKLQVNTLNFKYARP